MAASVRGHKDVVDALLRHGANVDQQNLDGHTALMFAYNGRNQVMTKPQHSPYVSAVDLARKSCGDCVGLHRDAPLPRWPSRTIFSSREVVASFLPAPV